MTLVLISRNFVDSFVLRMGVFTLEIVVQNLEAPWRKMLWFIGNGINGSTQLVLSHETMFMLDT